jgi:hypothetical protein
MGSKGWVPRTSAQRFGAFLVGAVFVAGSLNLIVLSFGLKGEFRASISSPIVGFIVSFLAVMMVLGVAFWTLWFGGRLLVGSFRHSRIRRGKSELL